MNSNQDQESASGGGKKKEPPSSNPGTSSTTGLGTPHLTIYILLSASMINRLVESLKSFVFTFFLLA